MVRTFTVLLVSFLVAACATSRDVYLADGSLGHNITCNGHLQNFSSCLDMAGEVCRSRGYIVISPRGEAVPSGTTSGAYTADSVAAYGGIQTQTGPIITRSLFVKCK
jgi:hypothetical protein